MVGLVVEGLSDYRVFQPLIRETVAEAAPNCAVQFRFLQPKPDATSSGYTPGGWTLVYKWCQRNPPNIRSSFIFQEVIAGTPACDLLVAHLDADVLQEYASKASVPLPGTPWSSSKRATFAESVLGEWLWSGAAPLHTEFPDRHIPVIAVWATETWLVAALDSSLGEPEEVDPVPLLINLKPDLEDNRRPGRLKKSSVATVYDSLALNLIQDLDRVRSVCNQLEKFCSKVEGYLARPSP